MKFQYDIEKRNKALTSLVLRLVLAGYLLHLAWQLVGQALAESGSFPEWAAWLAGGGFAAVAAAFLGYAWREFRRAMREARLEEPEDGDEE